MRPEIHKSTIASYRIIIFFILRSKFFNFSHKKMFRLNENLKGLSLKIFRGSLCDEWEDKREFESLFSNIFFFEVFELSNIF